MKLTLFIVFMISRAFAGDCYLFQLKGTVEDRNGFRITIHEGTNSAKFFVFPTNLDLRMAAYINKSVEGRFIFPTKDPVSGSVVTEIESSELSVPEPLNHHNEIKFLKNVPCRTVVKGNP